MRVKINAILTALILLTIVGITPTFAASHIPANDCSSTYWGMLATGPQTYMGDERWIYPILQTLRSGIDSSYCGKIRPGTDALIYYNDPSHYWCHPQWGEFFAISGQQGQDGQIDTAPDCSPTITNDPIEYQTFSSGVNVAAGTSVHAASYFLQYAPGHSSYWRVWTNFVTVS